MDGKSIQNKISYKHLLVNFRPVEEVEDSVQQTEEEGSYPKHPVTVNTYNVSQ